LVQWVSTRLLIDLWRVAVKTDARSSFAGVQRFGLWESPTGLYFFDPPRDGDDVFYSQFYAWLETRGLFSSRTVRQEFLMAANRIPADARVLDVGCGHANFRQCVPHAQYTGLDPNFGEGAEIQGVRKETLAEHLVANDSSYDAVCCFQVLEHVREPNALFNDILRAAKPGGLICIGVPHVPSALTRIPNFLINAPPHHLTWWTKTALFELATSAGAVVESIENAPWGETDAMIYWAALLSPIKCADVFFSGSWRWILSSLIGHLAGFLAYRLFGVPRRARDEGGGLVLFARKPAEMV
jgi:SAM-dependent methyltransferase